MRFLRLAALAASLLSPAAVHAQSYLVQSAKDAVPAMERVTGMPIVILTRNDNDPAAFWSSAMSALCAKTGDNWCDSDLYILQDTTNPIGWSRVLTYQSSTTGSQKQVCVVLPPRPGVDPGYVASGISGGLVTDWRDLPTASETEAWLWYLHAANCQNVSGDATEGKRADGYAALMLTLSEGDANFVSARDVTPARKFASWRNTESSRWAVNVGERILLEQWKKEAGIVLTSANQCRVTVIPSSDLATDQIQRDITIPDGQDCNPQSAGGPVGSVTDANLWLWGTGGATWPGIGMPPMSYTPFKTFDTLDAAVSYSFQTAAGIAQQR